MGRSATSEVSGVISPTSRESAFRIAAAIVAPISFLSGTMPHVLQNRLLRMRCVREKRHFTIAGFGRSMVRSPQSAVHGSGEGERFCSRAMDYGLRTADSGLFLPRDFVV